MKPVKISVKSNIWLLDQCLSIRKRNFLKVDVKQIQSIPVPRTRQTDRNDLFKCLGDWQSCRRSLTFLGHQSR